VLAAARLLAERGLSRPALEGLGEHPSLAVRRLVAPLLGKDRLEARVRAAAAAAAGVAGTAEVAGAAEVAEAARAAEAAAGGTPVLVLGIDALHELHDRGEL